jgi:hypothetical protein
LAGRGPAVVWAQTPTNSLLGVAELIADIQASLEAAW